MLRRQFRVKAVSVAMLLTFFWHFLLFETAALAATAEVPVGTVVMVVFNNAVDPAKVTIGQTLTLSVVNPVVIGKNTIIEAGAPVLAEVTIAEKNGAVGKPAKIGVTLRNVTAVDGTNIPLTGQKVIEGTNSQATSLVVTILCCILGLLMKGGNATISAGSQIQATTMSPATINIAE